jgi:predicted ribosome quality control (RQC) complex YloA/Tae2 family protein
MKIQIFEFEEEEYQIILGNNKFENSKLIDESEIIDIWFHVEDQPSCHVLLKNKKNLNDLPRQVIKRCAYLCKINSKAKTRKEKVKIMYTEILNVERSESIVKVKVKKCKVVLV